MWGLPIKTHIWGHTQIQRSEEQRNMGIGVSMRLSGKCCFCGKKGDWEGGLYPDRDNVVDRPQTWAGHFPVNVERLPSGSFRTEDLAKNNIITGLTCPDCHRDKNEKIDWDALAKKIMVSHRQSKAGKKAWRTMRHRKRTTTRTRKMAEKINKGE